jgi:hypothetical protein
MTTPENIQTLQPNEVFVFGSNYAGRHGKGAALTALRKFGARNGQGMGLMGQSYGIATKGWRLDVLPLPEIGVQVERFLRFARAHPELKFFVTEIGCGLAGYRPKDIAPLFGSDIPENIILPETFQHNIPDQPRGKPAPQAEVTPARVGCGDLFGVFVRSRMCGKRRSARPSAATSTTEAARRKSPPSTASAYTRLAC